MSSVHPDPAVIELAEAIEVEARRFSSDLYLDREVYGRLTSVRPEAARLRRRPHARRCAARVPARRGSSSTTRPATGCAGSTSARPSSARPSPATSATAAARRSVPVSALDGLPADFVEAHPADDRGPGPDHAPSTPTCTRSSPTAATPMRGARSRSSTSTSPGRRTTQVLGDLLRLRDEKAGLLGYPSWPDFDAEVKMIGSGAEIEKFVDRIAAEAHDAGHRDLAVLAGARRAGGHRARSTCPAGATASRRSSASSTASTPRRCAATSTSRGCTRACSTSPAGSSASPTNRVDAPTLARRGHVLRRAPGRRRRVDAADRPDPPRPAPAGPQVQPRRAVRPGAGVRERQLPEGVLVCNFNRGLMEHHEVVTLFHEFGHLMHHVLAGRHEWVRFSGVATEWDFVEAPSQMLEEWAWDAEVLQLFARDADGQPIPAELVERMRAADEFGKGFLARTQMFYAALSYKLHVEVPDDLTARMFELYPEYSLVAAARGHPLPRRVRSPRGLLLGLLHLHVVAGDREGPVQRLRPRRPARRRRWRTATATRCWRRAGRRTPPTWSRTSSVGPTTPRRSRSG